MSDRPPADDVRERAAAVLGASWRAAEGFCPPNPDVYPHLWLWDSCFHAVAWAALGDPRGVRELTAALSAQLPSGFVPHMRYAEATVARGPLPDRSSFTQPPMYAHALRALSAAGFDVPAQVVRQVGRALDWLWSHRRTPDGLLFVVHPWESGADDSPRWDDWIGVTPYDRDRYRAVDRRLLSETVYDADGAAVWSRAFVAVPAAFNALAAHAMGEYAAHTGEATWAARGRRLAAAADELLWDDAEGLWADRAVVGGAGDGVRRPTLDGVFGALVTDDPARASRVLDQLVDPGRFAAPYGLRYLPAGHPAYDGDAYWRGPSWPQLDYLAWLAALRRGRADVAQAVAAAAVAGAVASGFAEFRNPDTGRGLGAVPQGWAALAAAMR